MERDIQKGPSKEAKRAVVAACGVVFFGAIFVAYPPAMAGAVVCFAENIRQAIKIYSKPIDNKPIDVQDYLSKHP